MDPRNLALRNASPPAAGAGRDAVRTALGVVVGGLLAYVLPEGTDPEIRVALGVLALAVISPSLAAVGKVLRERGIEGWPFVFLLAVLLAGCATPIAVLGDAYYWRCDGESVLDAETGDLTCDGELEELRGGHLSDGAAAAIVGIKRVGAAAAGVP